MRFRTRVLQQKCGSGLRLTPIPAIHVTQDTANPTGTLDATDGSQVQQPAIEEKRREEKSKEWESVSRWIVRKPRRPNKPPGRKNFDPCTAKPSALAHRDLFLSPDPHGPRLRELTRRSESLADLRPNPRPHSRAGGFSRSAGHSDPRRDP